MSNRYVRRHGIEIKGADGVYRKGKNDDVFVCKDEDVEELEQRFEHAHRELFWIVTHTRGSAGEQ